MTKDLFYTKRLIKEQIKSGSSETERWPFTKYSKFYLMSNENQLAYNNFINFRNQKSALTVLASGDQLFNLVLGGVENIETFDSNLLTEYYVFGLKKAMILALNYKEFLIITKKLYDNATTLSEITEILQSFLPYMEEKYKTFWQTIIEYNYNMQKNSNHTLNLMHMLSINGNIIDDMDTVSFNPYLTSQENYEKLKSKLKTLKVGFKNIDASKIDKYYQDKYDIIILSNILDFFEWKWGNNWSYANLESYKKRLFQILNNDGIVFLNYIFSSPIEELIVNSSVYEEDLTDEELYRVQNISKFYAQDKILLSRQKTPIYSEKAAHSIDYFAKK